MGQFVGIHICEGGFLGEELSQESIGVFVGTTFPGTIGVGKVAGRPQRLGDLLMSVELLAVIKSQSSRLEGQIIE